VRTKVYPTNPSAIQSRELLLDMAWTRSNNAEGYLCCYGDHAGQESQFLCAKTKEVVVVEPHQTEESRRMLAKNNFRQRRDSSAVARHRNSSSGVELAVHRDSINCAFKMSNLNGLESRCEVVFEVQGEKDASNPNALTQKLKSMFEFRTLICTQMTFTRTAELSQLLENDGTNLGRMLMSSYMKLSFEYRTSNIAKSDKKRKEEMDFFFGYYSSMRELKTTHPFFRPMITAILSEKFSLFNWRSVSFKSSEESDISGKLSILTSLDGAYLGREFRQMLSFSANEEGAVDSFMDVFPALTEFNAINPFFRPMLTEISHILSSQVTWKKIFEAARR